MYVCMYAFMYVCIYVCMYTLMNGGLSGYWFDLCTVCMNVFFVSVCKYVLYVCVYDNGIGSTLLQLGRSGFARVEIRWFDEVAQESVPRRPERGQKPFRPNPWVVHS